MEFIKTPQQVKSQGKKLKTIQTKSSGNSKGGRGGGGHTQKSSQGEETENP